MHTRYTDNMNVCVCKENTDVCIFRHDVKINVHITLIVCYNILELLRFVYFVLYVTHKIPKNKGKINNIIPTVNS